MGRKPTAKAIRAIAKLGVAREPTGNFDREAYAAKVAMLADDCADLPDDILERACDHWRMTRPYLPQAFELREFVKSMIGPSLRTDRTWATRVADANAKLAATANGRRDIEWCVDADNDGMHLKFIKEH